MFASFGTRACVSYFTKICHIDRLLLFTVKNMDLSHKIGNWTPVIISGNATQDDNGNYTWTPDYALVLHDDICDIVGPPEK